MTVTSMTTDDCQGCERRFFMEPQLKVPIDTMIITATSAGIGIRATSGPSTTIRTRRKIPDTKVERRVSTPDLTFMTDCPRTEEHTSELQSLMRTSYAVSCLQKEKAHHTHSNCMKLTA